MRKIYDLDQNVSRHDEDELMCGAIICGFIQGTFTLAGSIGSVTLGANILYSSGYQSYEPLTGLLGVKVGAMAGGISFFLLTCCFCCLTGLEGIKYSCMVRDLLFLANGLVGLAILALTPSLLGQQNLNEEALLSQLVGGPLIFLGLCCVACCLRLIRARCTRTNEHANANDEVIDNRNTSFGLFNHHDDDLRIAIKGEGQKTYYNRSYRIWGVTGITSDSTSESSSTQLGEFNRY